MLKPFFLYREKADSAKAVLLLERLVTETGEAGLQDDLRGEIVARAALVLADLYKIKPQTPADLFATQVISFIDCDILENLVNEKEKTDVTELDALALQMLYVSAALLLEPEVVPYTAEEVEQMIAGTDGADLDPLILAATVGFAVISEDHNYNHLNKLLPSEPPLGSVEEAFEWEDAFLLGITLHYTWSYFPSASERDQLFILQHFLYRATVGGVPTRAWLESSFAQTLSGSAATQYIQALLSSVESVPQDVDLKTDRKLSEITHEFISAAVRETIPTLAQEKYLKPWYDNSVEGELYRAWLRDCLTIVYKLQTNTIHRA